MIYTQHPLALRREWIITYREAPPPLPFLVWYVPLLLTVITTCAYWQGSSLL